MRRPYDPFARAFGGYPFEAPRRQARRPARAIPVEPIPREPEREPASAPEPTREDRAAAADEIERVKERLARDGEREVERNKRELLASLLDVIDDLDRALAGADATGEADRALLEGVEMVRSGFLDKLANHGVERTTAIGDRFDPERHEALATAPAQHPEDEGCVVAIVRPGYRIGDDVLRPAGVVVGKRA